MSAALPASAEAANSPDLGEFKLSIEGVQTTQGTISTRPDQDGDGKADCVSPGTFTETVRFKTKKPLRIRAAFPRRLVLVAVGRVTAAEVVTSGTVERSSNGVAEVMRCGIGPQPTDCGIRTFKRWRLLVQPHGDTRVSIGNAALRLDDPFKKCQVAAGSRFPGFLSGPKTNSTARFYAKVPDFVSKLRKRNKVVATGGGKRVDRSAHGFDPASEATSTTSWKVTFVPTE